MGTVKPKLAQFKVIGFDVMGTLLDEKTGIITACEPVKRHLQPHVTGEQFFDGFETALRKEMAENGPPTTTYATIVGKAFASATQTLSGGQHTASPEESTTFAYALVDWPAFPDTVASLIELAKGAKLVGLSNMDTSTLVSIATTGVLKDVPFAALLGGDKSGAFKPDHRVNQNLLDTARAELGGVGKDQVLLIAQGLKSDHVPAKEMGIASAWIDRYHKGKQAIPEGADPTWVFNSLAELVAELS